LDPVAFKVLVGEAATDVPPITVDFFNPPVYFELYFETLEEAIGVPETRPPTTLLPKEGVGVTERW
jgi:hypothetical protein